jgi:hypothetical protein
VGDAEQFLDSGGRVAQVNAGGDEPEDRLAGLGGRRS